MRVVAIFDGFYGNEFRPEGSGFEFEEGVDALASWMVPVKSPVEEKAKPGKIKKTKSSEK